MPYGLCFDRDPELRPTTVRHMLNGLFQANLGDRVWPQFPGDEIDSMVDTAGYINQLTHGLAEAVVRARALV
jgi:hypothetical protein